LAKTGYGEMGVTGSIAGPLFNVLVGLGASLVKISFKLAEQGKEITIDISSGKEMLILIALAVLLFNIVRLFFHSCCLKFNLRRSISYVGFIIYATFFLIILYFTFFF
jgi:Ca2+/Na+ antiporter